MPSQWLALEDNFEMWFAQERFAGLDLAVGPAAGEVCVCLIRAFFGTLGISGQCVDPLGEIQLQRW